MKPKTQMPKLDQTILTPEQRDKLDQWQMGQEQLQNLQDIADMTQEVVTLLGDDQKRDEKTVSDMGALLIDIRESLVSLKSQEAPQMPDYAQPVVDAVSKLETALSASIKSLDTTPIVNVASPQVNVDAPVVDLSGIQKVLKSDIPDAFKQAIALIPPPEKDDYSPLLDAWAGISEQLVSIETATRMKPIPGSMRVSNLSEIARPGLIPVAFSRITFSSADGNGNYRVGTVKNGVDVVGALALAYDANSNLTDIEFTGV